MSLIGLCFLSDEELSRDISYAAADFLSDYLVRKRIGEAIELFGSQGIRSVLPFEHQNGKIIAVDEVPEEEIDKQVPTSASHHASSKIDYTRIALPSDHRVS